MCKCVVVGKLARDGIKVSIRTYGRRGWSGGGWWMKPIRLIARVMSSDASVCHPTTTTIIIMTMMTMTMTIIIRWMFVFSAVKVSPPAKVKRTAARRRRD